MNSRLGATPDQAEAPSRHRSAQWPTSWPALRAITSRPASPGRFAFPTARSLFFFRRTRSCCPSCCSCPTRHWWAYALAAGGAHFLATQQAHWPPLYALTCELFDVVKAIAAAAGFALINRSLKALTLRDAVVFILVAVVLVPFGAALLGSGLDGFHGFGTRYWIEWRNLGDLQRGDERPPRAGAAAGGALPVRPARRAPSPDGPSKRRLRRR